MRNNRHFTQPPSSFFKVCVHIRLLKFFYLYWIQSLNTQHSRKVPYLIPKPYPGASSWKSTRNAFLEVFQEHVPGVCPGTEIFQLKNYLKLPEMARNKLWENFLSKGGRCEIIDISHRPHLKRFPKKNALTQNLHLY